jgi:hypothetical protein
MRRQGARIEHSEQLVCLARASGVARQLPADLAPDHGLDGDEVSATGAEALTRCGIPWN